MRTASPSSCYYLVVAGGGRTTERTFSESVRQRPLWRTWTFAGASPGDAGTASPGDAGNVVSNTPFRECSGPPTREDGEGPRNSEKTHPPSTPPYVCPVNGGATLCRAPWHPLFSPIRPRGHPLLRPLLALLGGPQHPCSRRLRGQWALRRAVCRSSRAKGRF